MIFLLFQISYEIDHNYNYMDKIIIFFIFATATLTFSVKQKIKIFNDVEPLSIQGFYRLALNSTIFDTRMEPEGGLIQKSYWLYSSMPFTPYASYVANTSDQIILVVDPQSKDSVIQKMKNAGFENIVGYNNFPVSEYPGFKNVPKLIKANESLAINPRTHLDVRRVQEYKAKGVIQGSTLIPIAELTQNLQKVRDAVNIVVNCQSGGRARFAYSILKYYGINSTVIDDNFDNFAAEGLKIVPYQG